jgi:RNA polymerase sigma factor (sigma-70 family)
MEDPLPKDITEELVKEASGTLPTRKTLIERLDNWSDWSSWDEFYRTYSGFVFHVARKSGLSDDEANDVVQETFIGVAKNLQKKKFDTSLGSFKSFLLNQARWRILDQFLVDEVALVIRRLQRIWAAERGDELIILVALYFLGAIEKQQTLQPHIGNHTANFLHDAEQNLDAVDDSHWLLLR